ncbi:MAG: DUF3422 domain-containing protein [Pseudomonadota bacterium]
MHRDDHQYRQWAVDEMHLRRFVPVPDHCEIYQSVRLMNDTDRRDEDARLVADKPAFDEWNAASRFASGSRDAGIRFLWERHTEASTITLIFPNDCPDGVRAAYLRWFHEWDGAVIRATRIFVVPDEDEIDRHLDRHEIDRAEMICCDVAPGVRIWSDFGIHSDGFGRLMVSAGEVSSHERGRVIQRVQELGNYRNMALLGLPTVRQHVPAVDALERQLSDHAEHVARASDGEADDDLLEQLVDLSSQLELIRAATEFRLSATEAYGSVAADRLQTLNVEAVANHQTLSDFTERRLVPALRTCSVFRDRLGRIAERIARVMQTLDVRIDTRIKAQNLRLTTSMERSIQLQFRLQGLVETLSVIAAGYYLVGLIAYMIKGAAALPSGSLSDILIGAITLPAICLIYLLVRHKRGTMLKDED